MITKMVELHREDPEQELIDEAGRVLLSGGLVAFPTETVYGLGANALDEEAAKKTYAAKGRPSDNPLIVHIARLEDLAAVVKFMPTSVAALAKAFWPGPLTMIFEKSEIVPYGTTGGLETVAVRMPSDPIAQKVILAGGGYISAPSANTSGRPSPTTAQHVFEDLDGKIDMILDGGTVEIGLESTILDMTVEPPMILRPGAITKDMLSEVIGEVAVDQTIISNDSKQAPKAPGMKYRHYAPKAELKIVEGTMKEEILAIRQLSYAAVKQNRKIGIIGTDETISFYKYGIVKNIGTRSDESTIARNLYAVLREFDDEDVEEIISESFAVKGIGSAIMNRLEKAAGHTVIDAASIVSQQLFRRITVISETDCLRGPMAAALLKEMDFEEEYVITSRGVVVLFPQPVNPKVLAVMPKSRDYLENYTAKALAPSEITDDNLLICVDEQVRQRLLREYQISGEVYTFEELSYGVKIDNPYGRELTEYEAVRDELIEAITRLTERLNTTKGDFWYDLQEV